MLKCVKNDDEVVMKSADGHGAVYKGVMPSERAVKSMYDSGCRMFVNGKKLGKAEMLAYVKEKIGE